MEFKPIVAMAPSARMFDQSRRMGLIGRLLTSNRYVLGMALFLAVICPELAHEFVRGWGPWFDIRMEGIEPSLVCAAVAIIAGHLSLQQMGVLPLNSTKSLILPTFMLTFGASMLTLYLLKFQTGRYHAWTASLITVSWYFAVYTLRARILRPPIGLVGVPPESLGELAGNIRWKIIDRPRLNHRVAAVVVDPHADLTLEWSQFITSLVLGGVPVYHRAHIEEGLTGRVRFDTHADNNFGALLPSFTYLRMKRIVDLLGVIITAPIILPGIFIAALIVKLDSPGPAFFCQTRMGHRGQSFTCYKLRTMRIDHVGPSFTMEGDPRITRVGRIFRKWRIDELPQVLNILKGDMSWIGPRPEALELALHYAAHVPFYDYRHAVRPGVTGWAAVHQGNVAEVDAAKLKLEYDFYYIKYFSIWLDILTVLKTFQTIWSGFGSR